MDVVAGRCQLCVRAWTAAAAAHCGAPGHPAWWCGTGAAAVRGQGARGRSGSGSARSGGPTAPIPPATPAGGAATPLRAKRGRLGSSTRRGARARSPSVAAPCPGPSQQQQLAPRYFSSSATHHVVCMLCYWRVLCVLLLLLRAPTWPRLVVVMLASTCVHQPVLVAGSAGRGAAACARACNSADPRRIACCRCTSLVC